MRSKVLPRILLSLLGLALVLWGLSSVMLWFAGEKADAVIMHVRRQGGERNEVTPGRYTYIISYTFTLPDGRQVDGYTTKIGNAVYVKASGKSILPIRYFKVAPFINELEKDTQPSFRQLVYVTAGVFLIVAINRKTA